MASGAGRGQLFPEVLRCRLLTGRFGTCSAQNYDSGCLMFELQFVVTEETMCTLHHQPFPAVRVPLLAYTDAECTHRLVFLVYV